MSQETESSWEGLAVSAVVSGVLVWGVYLGHGRIAIFTVPGVKPYTHQNATGVYLQAEEAVFGQGDIYGVD